MVNTPLSFFFAAGNMKTPGQAVKGSGRVASLQRNRGHKAPPIRRRKPLGEKERDAIQSEIETSRGMNGCLNNSLKSYITQFLRKTPIMRKSTEFFRNISEFEEKNEKESDGEETPLQTAGKETKEPRGAAANEKPGEDSYDYQPTTKIMAPWLKKDDLILNCNRTEVQLAYVPVSISVVF